MAIIEVNHKTLRDVADAITTYCDAQDREMRSADREIKSMLSSDWVGTDARQFGAKWEGVDEKGSTSVKYRDSLKKYGKALKACAQEYQTAQEDVYNAASRLRKFFYW